MQDAKEEIKARLSIEDVVGQYIELKRAGRTFKGRSPWGVDKTPSFMVSPDKGIWHDFSANKGGDIFTFIMEVEGISFREALEKLASQAGVELKQFSANDGKLAAKKRRIKSALELATKYYQICLAKNSSVCEYVFYKRNLNKKTVVDFRIGYAPNGKDHLVRALKSKGYTTSELRDAGLLNQFDGDLFRSRMMVPFFDNTGDIIGSGFVVIVEGNMDVISSHQAGVREAVATSGTAMTEQHLKILSRLTNDIRLAYDGDAAGVAAAERAIGLANKLGINLKIISGYNGAKDPDELIQKDPVLWQECVESCEPAIDWLLKKYEERIDIFSGPGKKAYSDIAMPLINSIPDPVEQKHYLNTVAEKLEVSVEDLTSKKIAEKVLNLKEVKVKKPKLTNSEKQALIDSLEAILVFGGAAGGEIKFDFPEDETRISELELIFENQYSSLSEDELKKTARSLLRRYEDEVVKAEIANLTETLKTLENDDEKTSKILKQIQSLQSKLH